MPLSYCFYDSVYRKCPRYYFELLKNTHTHEIRINIRHDYQSQHGGCHIKKDSAYSSRVPDITPGFFMEFVFLNLSLYFIYYCLSFCLFSSFLRHCQFVFDLLFRLSLWYVLPVFPCNELTNRNNCVKEICIMMTLFFWSPHKINSLFFRWFRTFSWVSEIRV